MSDQLRATVAATLRPVRPLPSPSKRVLAVAPLALLLLIAAPLAFAFRDFSSLGWSWSWGASLCELAAGLATVALALNESIPGRSLSANVLVPFLIAIVALILVVTTGTWFASPVAVRQHWWTIGAMCLGASTASALPAVALSSVLIVRAYPVRPALAGAIAGLGSGLLSDAGWRLFCHFSEPAHVLAAHLGAIAIATVAGALLTRWLMSGPEPLRAR